MKQKLFSLILLMCFTGVMSQSNSFWQKSTFSNNTIKSNKQDLSQNQTFTLNLNLLKEALRNAPVRGDFSGQSNLEISFPNAEGKFERFEVMEASVMHPDLEAKYPDIKSYAGQGLDDPTARIRFSISTYGFQSMSLSALKPAVFIEQITNDGQGYAVYNREDRQRDVDAFECEVTAQANQIISGNATLRNADDSILRTYRLAVSATGEYTQYHGGTKAQALAAIVNTMTRVNGIFEVDFSVTMQLIANTDDVIYTSTSSDPYGNTTSGYNSALQNTLTSVIGESNYDIGHLFANLQNNGNAGCIGCVCVNGQKGSGWTSATVPEGDFFDVDYVAHEMGHQFGANHTWTFNGNEGTNVQVEPGSGSTIMSYAGITGATDVQANVHPNFHAVSIQQVTNYVKSTSCQTNTNTGNAVPTVNAGANYTIPRGTPFVLQGSASDADSGDVLSYSWEQMDENNASTTYPSTTATTGVAFRAYEPTSQNYRYFPRLETIKTGATSWQWEAVPNVARTLNFRLTVRDNVVGGGANNSDDMVVTVNGTAGPFVVNSPNTNVTWNAGTTQTVTWNVAGTTGNGVNAANVDIYLSTDGGDTYPIALAVGVPNDGSHDIVVPNNVGTQNRIMVRGSNNIFFDISNANFTIDGQVVCNATVPTGLAASSITSNSATLSWDAVPGASYDLQYRQVGSGTWTTLDVNGVSTNLSGLSTLTQYEAQVRSECPDTSTSAFSTIINFTTTDVQLNYCTSASTNINDEFIGRVQLNTIDNSSGGQFYTDFTSISTTLTKDTQYTITVTPTWTGTVYPEAYSVWIDYNRDGDFSDAGEQVWTQAATTSTPVSGSFTVPSSAVENTTTMRVSMKYNGLPTACETFTYGEVEDYTIIIEGSTPDTTAPVITLNGGTPIDLELGSAYTELGATAIDDVDGDISGNIVIGGDTVNTNAVGTYLITYNVSDAAGNAATEVIRTVNVNPDTTAPVITLNGASTININLGGTYTELGATAIDNIDGDISTNIVIGGDTVNANAAGTYIVTYNVNDSAGNTAAEVTRTVIVAPDTTAPVITLIGSSSISLELGDTYTELGATATDNVDGDISANVVIGGDVVDTNSAGTYIITYNVSDSAGNSATQVTRSVTVNPDTTIPVINIIGSSTVNLLVGDTYTEQGASASDNYDGNISANIVIGGDVVNTNAAGTYLVTYNVSDSSGNAANEVVRTVNVSEPSIGCSGGISTYPYFESFENTLGGWTQSNADDIDWTVDASGTPSSNTGPSSAIDGSYYIYVEASSPNYPSIRAIINSPCFDLSGMAGATFSFAYHMYGASDMGTIDLEISDDDGATWTSIWNQTGNQGNQWLNVDISLNAYVGKGVQLRFNRFIGSTWQADIAIDNINLSEPAVPTCSDGIQNGDETGVDCGGSFCVPCSTPDTTAPEITLNGATPVNLELGSSYTELGATAIDDVDGDISANIVIGGDSVDTNTVGTYIVTYNVSDAAGNSANQVTRTVNVNPDSTAPVITLNGASTVNINVGGNYTELGATATDNVDGDISANIVIGGDTVNTNTAGTYIVTYNVSDAAGNAATQVTRTVNVAPDTTAPVITLIGSASITLELGDTYTEQGATATDDIDGDISANIVIGGDTVNTNIASTYIITYNVSDAAGNSAAQVTRTVTVNPDTTIPVINLIGSSTINLLVGDIYTELGATATDNVDGDITANIIIGGDSVNTNVAGTYLITYNVSDSSGNAATQVTRTVNVSEPSSGCSGGISTFPYTEGFENTLGGWSQSTADDIDWTINANGTPSSNTGPSSASQGSYYIYVEASSPNYPSKRAILNSPCFDLSGMTSPSFDFDYHMYGASDMGTIDLEASTDDGNTWTSIWNESGNKGNQWNSASVDLSAYAGGTVQLRFNRFVGSTWQADIAIDNINLSEPAVPTCSDGIQNGDETGVDCGGSFCVPCSTTDVILNQGYFETGWDSWEDGGSDVARVLSTNSYEGSYSIRIRDNSGTASAMTLSNIDVTPYSQVVIDFYFYVLSMENGEDFWVRFYDGSAWNTVATYVSGSGISNNTFYNATVTLTPAQYNFAVNSGFRFQCDASGNNDQIFIDQVTITGTNSGRGDVNQIVKIKTVSPDENIEGNLKMYPNPVKGNVLTVELLETDKFTYTIKNMLGQVVVKGISEGKVDVSELNAGMYFIEVNDGEDIITKKFIRQ